MSAGALVDAAQDRATGVALPAALAPGLGGFLNFNAQVFSGLRLIANGFWAKGGGRYIFGQAPDLIVRPDASLSTVTFRSTVEGLDLAPANTLLFADYGGVYIGRNDAPAADGTACADATSCVGYGYPGAPSNQNKWIHEATGGFVQAFWKDAKYGGLSVIGQYSYVQRDRWSVAPGGPSNTHDHMVFLGLRYTLPGAPPKMAY